MATGCDSVTGSCLDPGVRNGDIPQVGWVFCRRPCLSGSAADEECTGPFFDSVYSGMNTSIGSIESAVATAMSASQS